MMACTFRLTMLLLAGLGVGLVGCNRAAPGEGQTVRAVSTEPGEIELSEPVVTLLEANKVGFAVRYRFTKGRPEKYYMCEIAFPGTQNQGVKPMESWELKSEGVIRDSIVLSQPPVQTFEIRVTEADSPQAGYTLISNVVRGTVK